MIQYKLAYTAGLFDGEGSVGLVRHHRGAFRTLSVSVPSCTREITTWLRSNFGGTVSRKRVYSRKHRASTVWTLTGRRALNFLDQIKPYLLEPEKIRRTELVLYDYRRVTPRNGKYSVKILREKRRFERDFFRNTRRRLVSAL